MGRKSSLTRDDWITAGLAWVADQGVAALAVEPLARTLGVSKGGFYWCFDSRDALLVAMLERWEAEQTRAIIELVERVPDSARQAEELIRLVTRSVTDAQGRAQPAARLQYAWWCAAADPLVGPSVNRATQARVDYLALVFERAGLPGALARQRALLGYASYVGLVMLAATGGALTSPGVAPMPGLVDAYLQMVLSVPPRA